MVEGVWVVTSITGPWGEPFLRDVEHDPEDHFDIDWTSINVDDLYPQRRKLLGNWHSNLMIQSCRGNLQLFQLSLPVRIR